ncbi:hypothetical protein UFOVP694_27 [uncultured Caudovirales phage]|uniref:Uncharacterized protein n=1 Tax=uncultured Caudovirales phage TaxID=2100421 RepID=A0A6J5NJ75_9CAUD|nr:hypothetical protein UFOVP694_27 [uncultured Caudovirales phage]
MATAGYITGRKRYQRPQAVLWSDNAGTLSEGLYVPNGYEVGADVPGGTDPDLVDQFLILSDHNRGEIDISTERLEQRQRTINGRMRSYHIADKLSFSWSWSLLPSRAFYQNAAFNETTGISPYQNNLQEFTADGGAGGVALLDWYQNHKGPFWMYLAYDKYSNFGDDNAAFGHLEQYNQIVQVYFADFNYSIVKRGGNNFDLWNISVTLEEV